MFNIFHVFNFCYFFTCQKAFTSSEKLMMQFTECQFIELKFYPWKYGWGDALRREQEKGSICVFAIWYRHPAYTKYAKTQRRNMAINKVSSKSQGAVAYDWREHAYEKGYKRPVAHLSCLDTNYLIPPNEWWGIPWHQHLITACSPL